MFLWFGKLFQADDVLIKNVKPQFFFSFLNTLKKINTHKWFLRRKFNAFSNVFNLADYLNTFFFYNNNNKLTKYIKVILFSIL